MTKTFIDTIKKYYFDRFDDLELGHQFHFASRMASWSNDPIARKKLDTLKDRYVVPPDNQTQKEYLHFLMHTAQTGRRVAHELRAPFFELYPQLFGFEKAIFRVRHLFAIYGINVKDDFLSLYTTHALEEFLQKLSKDHDALRALSSFAVNTFYLSEILFGVKVKGMTPEFWYAIGLNYDLQQKEHLQLLIYLYTHCIIADTNFYARDIPAENITSYKKMLLRLESIIDDHFERISLDNKLEFLVAAKILGLTSHLQDRIYIEASRSISPNGDFIIEALNENLRPDRQTFAKAEHRNVLLIMTNEQRQQS